MVGKFYIHGQTPLGWHVQYHVLWHIRDPNHTKEGFGHRCIYEAPLATSDGHLQSVFDNSGAKYPRANASTPDSAAPKLTLRHRYILQRCLSVRFGGAESDVEAFAHGYVALILSNTDFKCVLKVNLGASYGCSDASGSDSVCRIWHRGIAELIRGSPIDF